MICGVTGPNSRAGRGHLVSADEFEVPVPSKSLLHAALEVALHAVRRARRHCALVCLCVCAPTWPGASFWGILFLTWDSKLCLCLRVCMACGARVVVEGVGCTAYVVGLRAYGVYGVVQIGDGAWCIV